MKLILGLGNPGEEYAGTRHNIGRRLVEHIAVCEKIRFSSKKSQKAALATVSWEEPVHLAYPLTYMNLSGEAVAALVKYWKIEFSKDLLIVVDDVALPFGKFRFRGEGSAGGHNGLASIETHLGSRVYPRLRIGIGGVASGTGEPLMKQEEPLRDYVLSNFKIAEERKMEGLLQRGLEACREWTIEPLTEVMNCINAGGGI